MIVLDALSRLREGFCLRACIGAIRRGDEMSNILGRELIDAILQQRMSHPDEHSTRAPIVTFEHCTNFVTINVSQPAAPEPKES